MHQHLLKVDDTIFKNYLTKLLVSLKFDKSGWQTNFFLANLNSRLKKSIDQTYTLDQTCRVAILPGNLEKHGI